MPLKELSKRIANYMHVYTLYSAVRPFGATVMLGSWTEDHGAEVMTLKVQKLSNLICAFMHFCICMLVASKSFY